MAACDPPDDCGWLETVVASVMNLLSSGDNFSFNLEFGNDNPEERQNPSRERSMVGDAVGQDLDDHADKVEAVYQTMGYIPGADVAQDLYEGDYVSASVSLASNFVPGGKIWSVVKNNKKLLKYAQQAGVSHGDSINRLLANFMNGNVDPGSGTKHLFSGVFELRSRNGARVYFRFTEEGTEIVGYSNKNNQQQVINILKEEYSK